MRYTVEYNPDLSKHAERFISLNITPSMTSSDEDSSLYPIDYALEELEGENDKVFNQDIKSLKELLSDGVTYIEI